MRLDDELESKNVEDLRKSGMSGRMGRKIPSARMLVAAWPLIRSLVRTKTGMALLTIGVMLYFFGGGIFRVEKSAPSISSSVDNEKEAVFVKKVLRSTEKVWSEIFGNYTPPVLVLYRGYVRSGCGFAQAQSGPFYCSRDRKIYLDLGFYDELKNRYSSPGDFAQAYVLAHEVGHHIQNLTGILGKVHHLQQQAISSGRKKIANKLQIPVELQADCYAGVWAHYVRSRLEKGDIEEALNAASQIGDDTLQKKSQGFVVPDSFTHGTSRDRMEWFYRGYRSGDIKSCDTYSKLKMSYL